jgi:hypothetical protein
MNFAVWGVTFAEFSAKVFALAKILIYILGQACRLALFCKSAITYRPLT